ncbi:HAMP domain-containing sensor histidine kinase [uncultured Ferrimonas sp.]|uniref:sensor histidine kinase n=1 Tax=uncultured Ferrimonas sp. TaxID=432640 RepID=UPI0026364448|nr:HAMP domain-containing sensor histidine kinase [uncultured Ferrimonas sp.]
MSETSISKVSIQRDIYLYLFGIVLLLSGIYLLMINHSYEVGLNESAKYGFLYELKLAEQHYVSSGQLPQYQSNTLQIYTDWTQLPRLFQQQFDWASFYPGAIYQTYLAAETAGKGQYLYAALHQIDGTEQYLYVVSQYDEALYLALYQQHPPEATAQFNAFYLLIALLLLLVFVAMRLLIHRLTKPILRLSHWSKSLDLDDSDTLSGLRYREVDGLAQRLVASVKAEREAIERESFFLSAASHELRTPVATISASGEMLTRLQQQLPGAGQRAVARIERAVSSMQTLITTLLWLSRDAATEQANEGINAPLLLQEVVDSQRYLLEGKAVTVTMDATHSTLQLPKELLHIVLTNLVRNAMQHCSEGGIDIQLEPQGIRLINACEPAPTPELQPTSFGIGLVLVERICAIQGWAYQVHQQQGQYRTSIQFAP